MKTILITFIAPLLIFTHQLCAQELKLGAKGGLNVSNFGGDLTNVESRAGFHVGGYGNLEFMERVSFQAELLYSLQGMKIEDRDIKANLSYLNIPILAQINLPEISDGFSAYAGPQFGFLLSANQKGTFNGNDIDFDTKENYKGVDVSWVFGAGYEMDSGLNFGIRYNIGLNDINDQTGEDAGVKVTNQVLQLWVGYLLWGQ